MSAPGYLDPKFRPGVDGTPNDDAGPIIGAMDGAAVFVTTDPNTRLSNVTFPATGSPVFYHGGGYVDLDSAGDLLGARLVLRNGAQPNVAAGPVQLVSTSAADTDDAVITGYISGALVQRTVTLAGLTPVTSVDDWDADGVIRIDYGQIPVGNLTASVMGQTTGIIWKTVVLPTGQTRLGTWHCTTEWQLALADTKGATIGSASRLIAPDDISAFARASRWPGNDQSLSFPGGRLDGGENCGWVERFEALAGGFPTTLGYHEACPGLAGTPVA